MLSRKAITEKTSAKDIDEWDSLMHITLIAEVEDALRRLRRLLGETPDWAALSRFLPEGALEAAREGDLPARASVAATFAASLQLAKEGTVLLRQGRPFGPIYVKPLAAQGLDA